MLEITPRMTQTAEKEKIFQNVIRLFSKRF